MATYVAPLITINGVRPRWSGEFVRHVAARYYNIEAFAADGTFDGPCAGG